VAAAYSEPSVLLYKLETGASVTIAAASPARSLAFSNRGTMLAVGLESGGIDLRTVPGGVQIESAQKVHRNAAGNVTFTRNDALLASHAVVGDGVETAITVVPVPSLQPSRAFIARLSGRPPAILVASQDFVAGVNSDGTIDLWDTRLYTALGSIKASNLPLTAASFSLDQRHLLIADEDGAIRSISVGGASWLKSACKLAGRTLTRAEWLQYLSEDIYRPACATDSGDSPTSSGR
jgi:WD40 repeat protein